MKKIFMFMMAAAIAVVSCQKAGDKGTGNDSDNEGATGRKVLLALASEIDEKTNEFVKGRKFRYNADGSLAGVDENWFNEEGEEEKYILNVTREDNVLTFTNGDGEVEYEFTVNEKGYIVESGDFTFEYDADDHLVKVIEDWGDGPQVQSIITWENGNMTSWTREGDAEDGSGNARVKRQTYKSELNVGGIFTAYTEKGSLKRWMFEAGLCGKASKNLVATDKWDDRDSSAEFEYRYDEDGYVVSETKYYGGELDDQTYFMWQAAE